MDGPVLNSEGLERLATALGPRVSAAPGISTESSEAVLAGATRVFSGYVERLPGGVLRIVSTVEELSTGKSLRTVSAEDRSLLGALGKLAREITPAAKPLPTTNDTAVRLYATALESQAGAAAEDLGQAVRLDPEFGSPWLALARLDVARGSREEAAELIGQARRQKLDALTLAKLDATAATLNNAPASVRIAAERKVALLSPADTVLLRSVAQSEIDAGEFASGAEDWKKIADALPNDPPTWNAVGYARSYAGDYNGALAALREYARLRPQDANPLDSIGDLNYRFRKYGDAAASYQQASAKDPAFDRYGDLYKTAWAKFKAGDKAGADAAFAAFRAAREKSGDLLIVLPEADWLYRTGRGDRGFASLRQSVASAQLQPLRDSGYLQLAIWDLLAGDRVKAAADAMAAGPVTTAPVALARFIALPSASAAEWEARANSMLAGPAMASLRPLALGYALLLDGKREAATPVWQNIAAQTRATDFFLHAIATRLEGKSIAYDLLPDPNTLNPFSAVLDKL